MNEEINFENLEKIIDENDFNPLIGKIENDFFDCKSQIYDLSNENLKRELAKDVSSFANLNGGFILIGPKTMESKVHFGDEVKEINFIDKNLINTEQYNGVINDWIYPKIDGVEIKWLSSKENISKGILIVKIPPQRDSLKPFLIKKIVDQKKSVEIMFGFSKRKQDKSESLKIEEIHRTVRDGLFYHKNIENRFNNLEATIQPLLEKRMSEEQKNIDAEITNKRINEIFHLYDK
jgi:predicted HTH transcriptional regulator